MEVSKVDDEDKIRWVLTGEMDEDSVLGFESMILNSQDLGSEITIDMSELTSLPDIGAKSFKHIANKLNDSGSSINFIGASELVSRKLRLSGLDEIQ
jgi:anti-anti-sigma regulatory factor